MDCLLSTGVDEAGENSLGPLALASSLLCRISCHRTISTSPAPIDCLSTASRKTDVQYRRRSKISMIRSRIEGRCDFHPRRSRRGNIVVFHLTKTVDRRNLQGGRILGTQRTGQGSHIRRYITVPQPENLDGGDAQGLGRVGSLSWWRASARTVSIRLIAERISGVASVSIRSNDLPSRLSDCEIAASRRNVAVRSVVSESGASPWKERSPGAIAFQEDGRGHKTPCERLEALARGLERICSRT